MDGSVTVPLAKDERKGGNISGKEPLRAFWVVYLCSSWVLGLSWYIIPWIGGWTVRDEAEERSLNDGRTARSNEDMNAIWFESETI